MGKKLTTWEKKRREKEKKENAANSRAETAARREKERGQKEKLNNLQTDLGNAIVSLFNIFMKQLVNLTLAVDIKKISAQNHLKIPQTISFKYPGDNSYSDLKSNLIKESFNPNNSIAELQLNMNMKYESYKSKYGSFFGNIFGNTKKDHVSFINKAQIDFLHNSELDTKRRNDFENALKNYEEELVLFNKKAKEELSIANKDRLNRFTQIQSEITIYNSSLDSTKKEIENVLVTAEIYESLFGLGLPITFIDLDSTFEKLSNLVKEFQKDSYDSPSLNFKYGLSISNEQLHLYLVYKDTFFPLPFEKQINSIKGGYSIQPLTKANRDKIEKNLIPSAALSFAAYAFNTSKGLKDLKLSIGKETIDKKTGSDMLEWKHTFSIERLKLMSLTFENIEPEQTLSIFSLVIGEPLTSKIKWFDKKQKVDHFNLKLQELNRLDDYLILLIKDFKKDSLPLEMPQDLKKLMKRVGELKG